MKKYVLSENQYIKLRNVLLETSLRTYIFDWDDNILYMPTTIKMDKKEGGKWVPVDVPTDEYAHIRTSPEYRLRDNSPGIAFSDLGSRNLLLRILKKDSKPLRDLLRPAVSREILLLKSCLKNKHNQKSILNYVLSKL